MDPEATKLVQKQRATPLRNWKHVHMLKPQPAGILYVYLFVFVFVFVFVAVDSYRNNLTRFYRLS